MRISDWSSDVCSSDLREPRVAHQGEVLEARLRLDLRQGDRLDKGLHRLDVDHAEAPGRIAGAGVIEIHHLDDANDLLLITGMIEEGELAERHSLHVDGGMMVRSEERCVGKEGVSAGRYWWAAF